ncbi:ABC transporter type 1, transmembrane domain-containing protein [Circinella umbellata]|nr:ABC transporter type 1, transmembrane domain-containing protein [Circinella umbellata]
MNLASRDQEVSSWISECSQNWEPYGCFEDVHLMLIPIIFLLLLAPFRIYILVFKRNPLAPDVARSQLYFVKLVALLLLLFTMVANLILTQTHHFVVQTITIITLLVAIILHHIEYTRNSNGSGVLLFYWLFTTLVNGYRLWAGGPINAHHIGLFTITYILSCLMFVLENCKCPIKEQAIHLGNRINENENICPDAKSNIFEKLIFSWMNCRMQQLSVSNSFWWSVADDQACSVFQDRWRMESKTQSPSLFRALLLNYPTMQQLFTGWLMKLFYHILQFTQPLLLSAMMNWIISHTALTQQIPEPLYKGASIAFYIFFVSVIQSLLLQQFLHLSTTSCSRLRSVLINAICRKSLSAIDVPSINKVQQCMKDDIQTLVDLFKHLHLGWSIPLRLTIGLVLLYHMVGSIGWVGVGVMFVNIPVKLLLERLYQASLCVYNINQNKQLRIIRDILHGFRIVKSYAWEMPFMRKMIGMKNNELNLLRHLGIITATQYSIFSNHFTPLIASFATFFTFSHVYHQQTLSNQFMLVIIAIYDLLNEPVSDIVLYLQLLVRSRKALKKLQLFLSSLSVSDPVTPHSFNHYQHDGNYNQQHQHGNSESNLPIIEVQQAAFRLPSQPQLILQSLDLSIKKGELIGVVGSRRTDIIKTLLGQLVKTEGELFIRGSVAYVSQDPWIFNSNLQDNIVFGRPWDPLFYRNVLDLCDISEEQSIQKQKSRISLARAIYSRADVYLLDDPFNVEHDITTQLARRLFHRVIQGHLRTKTRIFATHTFSYLHQLERIIMLWDGKLVMDGTFGDLMSKQRGQLYHIMAINQDQNNIPYLDENSNSLPSLPPFKSNNLSFGRSNNNIDDDNGNNCNTIESNFGLDDTDGENEQSNNSSDQEEQMKQCWSTYAKSCSIIAITTAILLQVLSQVAKIGSYVWLNYGQNATITKSCSFLTIFAIIGICSILLHTIQCIFLWLVCVTCSAKYLHSRILSNIMRAPSNYFNNNIKLQNIIHRLGIDMKRVTQDFPKLFHRYLLVVTSLTGAIAIIAFSTPFFILFLIPLGFCFIHLRRHYLRASLRYHHLVSASESHIDSIMVELVNGSTTIRTYKQDHRFIADSEAKVANYQRICFLAASCDRWVAIRAEFLGALALLGAALFAVLDVVYGAAPVIDAGLSGLSLYYAMRIPSSLSYIIRLSQNIELKMASIKRIQKSLPHEQNEHKDTISISPSWPEYGRVVFQNYTSYTTDSSLFNDATFTINPGERISVVGGDIRPDLLRETSNNTISGNIDIDGIDIHTLRLSDLRSRITVILAEPILFEHATLRENLDPLEQYDDLVIWEILKLVQLDVQGDIDAPFYEHKFTKEQCWLLTFARALLRAPQVLIIEESNEIGVEVDEIVRQILQDQLSGSTRIIITSKLDTVMESDRVLVFDQGGHINAFDTPHNILKYKGSLLNTLGSSSWDGFNTINK